MNQPTEQWVRIDVSKASLDVYLHPLGRQWCSLNTELGISEILQALAAAGVALVVLEATGGMEQAITQALNQAGIAVVVSSPRRVRDFAKALGKLAKTDRIDAEVLARYGQAVRPEASLSLRGSSGVERTGDATGVNSSLLYSHVSIR